MNQLLEQDGFVRLPGFMSAAQLATARARVSELEAEEGESAGAEWIEIHGGQPAIYIDRPET